MVKKPLFYSVFHNEGHETAEREVSKAKSCNPRLFFQDLPVVITAVFRLRMRSPPGMGLGRFKRTFSVLRTSSGDGQ
eukprot:3407602-Amphidinium_carterae.1